MSMLTALKDAEKKPPVNVVNSDIQIVEEIDGGAKTVVRDTTPQGTGERVKFKPVARSAEAQADAVAHHQTPSDNFDLVGDDISASPAQQRKGRTRLYPDNKARQQAYRDRQKSGD